MADDTGKELVGKFDRVRSERMVWHSHWQDIRDLVRPHTSDFDYEAFIGEKKTAKIFDGTAPWALEQLVSSLHSYLTSPVDRWFNVTIKGVPYSALPPIVLEYLEAVADKIYSEYSRPQVNFNSSIHEFYLDICAFGTGNIYQTYDPEERHIVFRSFPLADCYIIENKNGEIDTMYRVIEMTSRQINQKFDKAPDDVSVNKDKNQDKKWKVIHAVFPRTDRDKTKLTKTNKKFASIWVMQQTKDTLEESGFDNFPYHSARWTKLAGEIYGRSPGMTCLPDIKMLNQMSKTTIKAAQKIVDPPLLVPDDGFVLPIRTAPGAILIKEAGAENIEPLVTGGNVELGLAMEDQRRTAIIRCFFVDWLLQQKNNIEMTATEVVDRREEKFRQLGPVLGRLQSELLGPMLVRTYQILDAHNQLPLPPAELQGVNLGIEYVSPASRAQYGSKALAIRAFINDITPMIQSAPQTLDIINVDELAKETAKMRDVTRKILRTDEEVAGIRQARAEKEQQALAASAGKDMASAFKDVSKGRRDLSEAAS